MKTKPPTPIKGNFEQCVKQANGFLETARWCANDTVFMPQEMKSPFIVNLSFACECFIKAIMIKESNQNMFISGHDLQHLFCSLSLEAQQKIKKDYEARSSNDLYNNHLDDLLQKIKNSFQEWRYAFEDTDYSLKINASNCLNFAACLQDYVASLEVK